MKKILVLTIIMIILFSVTNKEKVIMVNSELETDEMITVLLTIPGLNTNNFTNYFDNSIEIIGIYPKINLIYQKKIGNMFYTFDKVNIKQNINSFSKYFKNVLEKYNFNNDLILINYNGINIDKVKLYISSDDLNKFMKNCNNCKYEKTSLY